MIYKQSNDGTPGVQPDNHSDQGADASSNLIFTVEQVHDSTSTETTSSQNINLADVGPGQINWRAARNICMPSLPGSQEGTRDAPYALPPIYDLS